MYDNKTKIVIQCT